MTPPTTIAVESEVPSARAARRIAPSAPAGWPTIEFSEAPSSDAGRRPRRWSSVVCIGFEAPCAT